jgi:Regulator of chromosome condensation (RCC1) repeat
MFVMYVAIAHGINLHALTCYSLSLLIVVVVHVYTVPYMTLCTTTLGLKGPINFGDGLTVKAVACGDSHTCVILSDNGTRCFGAGAKGQLVSMICAYIHIQSKLCIQRFQCTCQHMMLYVLLLCDHVCWALFVLLLLNVA